MAQTHWKKLTNPNYLGAYSLDDGKDIVLTIDYVRQEQVVGSDGKKEECIVCHFKERDAKPMIMNVTNCKTVQKLTGTPYIEKWTGIPVQIGIEKVAAFGTVTDALRIRPFAPQNVKTVTLFCDECGSLIEPANGMNPEQLAAYTKSKYGRALCADCAKKIATAKKSKSNELTEAEKAEILAEEAKEGK